MAAEVPSTSILPPEDARVTIDMDGTILGWNEGAEDLFGWRRNEVIGRAVHDVVIPDAYRPAHLRGIAGWRNGGRAPIFGQVLSLMALTKSHGEIPVTMVVNLASNGGTGQTTARATLLPRVVSSLEALASSSVEIARATLGALGVVLVMLTVVAYVIIAHPR